MHKGTAISFCHLLHTICVNLLDSPPYWILTCIMNTDLLRLSCCTIRLPRSPLAYYDPDNLVTFILLCSILRHCGNVSFFGFKFMCEQCTCRCQGCQESAQSNRGSWGPTEAKQLPCYSFTDHAHAPQQGRLVAGLAPQPKPVSAPQPGFFHVTPVAVIFA